MEVSKMNEKGKIINSFYIVGLKDKKLSKQKEEEMPPFIQNIDIVLIKIDESKVIIEKENEKWIRIMKGSDSWMRIQYSKTYQNPITEIKIIECEMEPSQYILVQKKYLEQGFNAVNTEIINDDLYHPILKENETIEPYNDYFSKIPVKCNIKDYLQLPVKSQGAILLVSRRKQSLPLKEIKFKANYSTKSFQLGISKHTSPYSYSYFPEILDTYPKDANSNPGIAVFCFPQGVQITQCADMPKWFNFILTNEKGQRSYGSVLVFNEEITNELMDCFVPNYKPKDIKHYIEKAICILSNYPFFYNCKMFLKELYRMHFDSGSLIPLERAICQFVDSLFFESFDKVLSFPIGEEDLKFYRIPIYGDEWDINDDCIEVLFNLLTYRTIIILWEGLLLERKIILKSSSKSTLVNISMGLINLLFPFKWIHTLVPILPEKMQLFLESPVPFLIGVNYPIDLSIIPNDALLLDIDKDLFEFDNEEETRFPAKLLNNMVKKLYKIKTKFNFDQPVKVEEQMNALDFVFPKEKKQKAKFDAGEIRDIFYDFFIQMFKHYERYFRWNKDSNNNNSLEFVKDAFLKDHDNIDEKSFLYKFIDTTLFTQFQYNFEHLIPNSPIAYFINSIKKGKGKFKHFLPNKIPSISTVKSTINVNDLGGRKFSYKTFPNTLDQTLFIQREEVRKVYISKFIYSRDEWCYDPEKLNSKEWAQFLMYSIYEIWFTFFSFVIIFYDDEKAKVLMKFALSLIEDLITNKKISPSMNLLTKVVKSCGRNCLTSFVKQLINLVNANKKKNNEVFYFAFMNGLYSLYENIEEGMLLNNSTLNDLKQSVMVEIMDNNINEHLFSKIEKTIFLLNDYCPYCVKNKKGKKLDIAEILGGFSRRKGDYWSICPLCCNKIFPKLYFIREDQMILDTENVNFLSPLNLVKEIDNFIRNRGEKLFFQKEFYQNKEHRNIFWNLTFYFQLFDLPLCVMYVENEDDNFIFVSNLLEQNQQRRENLQNGIMSQTNILIKRKELLSVKEINLFSKNEDKDDIVIKNEKKIWEKIREKVEKIADSALMKSLFDNNAKNNKSENSLKLDDIKQVLSKVIGFFLSDMKQKLEKALSVMGFFEQTYEIQDMEETDDKNDDLDRTEWDLRKFKIPKVEKLSNYIKPFEDKIKKEENKPENLKIE